MRFFFGIVSVVVLYLPIVIMSVSLSLFLFRYVPLLNIHTYRRSRPIFPPDQSFQLRNTKVGYDSHLCTFHTEPLCR